MRVPYMTDIINVHSLHRGSSFKYETSGTGIAFLKMKFKYKTIPEYDKQKSYKRPNGTSEN